MDSLKEIYEAISQRIKSPIWGYVFLSLVGFNWKPLYFLFFSGERALIKFEYFDTNTSVSTLLWWPVGVGLIAALAAPYISNWGAWWATRPTNEKRIREVSAAHEVLKARNKLLAERENEKAIYERSLIEEAKRDEEVGEIKDDERREELQEKFEKIRKDENFDAPSTLQSLENSDDNNLHNILKKKRISISSYFNLVNLSDLSLDILREMKRTNEPVCIGSEVGNFVISIGRDARNSKVWTTGRGPSEGGDSEYRKLAIQPISSLEEIGFLELVQNEKNMWKITDLGLQYLNWLSQKSDNT